MRGWACGAQAHGDDAGMANGAPAQQGAATGSGEKAGPKGGRESGASEKNAKMFRRVVAEEWLGKKGAWDNSYSATFGDSGWGAKAEAVLGSVRSLCGPLLFETRNAMFCPPFHIVSLDLVAICFGPSEKHGQLAVLMFCCNAGRETGRFKCRLVRVWHCLRLSSCLPAHCF